MRFWVSWYEPTGSPDKGARKIVDGPPFFWWDTGRGADDSTRTLWALVDAADEDSAKELVGRWFAPRDWRFCDEKPAGWRPAANAILERFDAPESPLLDQASGMRLEVPPERILPTEPGPWWLTFDQSESIVITVYRVPTGELWFQISHWHDPMRVDHRLATWLAPIPTPEKLAAQAVMLAAGQALADHLRGIAPALCANHVFGQRWDAFLAAYTPAEKGGAR